MNRKIVVGCGLLLVAGILTVGIWAISRVPPVYQPPKPAPLPRVVEHYENQLDPEIPKITVTAIQDDEAFKLPYDAVLIDGSAEPDDPEGPKDWFLNLMNNFWSLPELCHDFLSGRNPARFIIEFEQPPDDEVTITNYWIYEYGTVSEHSTREEWDRHSKTFVPGNCLISFDLWDNRDDVVLTSDPPPLLGLRMQCRYGTDRAEYYILFQNADPNAGFAEDFDFSHLTPLEGLEEE